MTMPAPPPAGGGKQWYAAPDGVSSGDGSMSRPWDLESALSGSKGVQPGDTVRFGKIELEWGEEMF